MRIDRVAWAAIGCLAAAAVSLSLILPDASQSPWFSAIGATALLTALGGLVYRRPRRRVGWVLVIAGFAMFVVGDGVFAFETAMKLATYPAPSDAVYLGSYLLLAAGAVVFVRSRRGRRDLTALLDALIIATGFGVMAAVFVIAPMATDSELSPLAKVVYSTYPIADLLLLAILVRLLATPGARTASFRYLLAAFFCTLIADAIWNLTIIMTGEYAASQWSDILWLSSYVLVAAATWSPSMVALAEPPPTREDIPLTRRRLIMLSGGLMLPALALLLDGAGDNMVLWPVVGVGSVMMSILVLARMAGLLHVVQVQAVRLSALARADALTGAPNRRTWDHELSRACQASRENATPLCIAMVDLDHFKAYNDTFGHQAGDRVLREAVAGWTERLGDRGMLARYGGEEFALLLPGMTPEAAALQVNTLRQVTPAGQTFSAGVTLWDPTTEPGAAVARADTALYEAKRLGRDRVVIADGHTPRLLPPFEIALQPIVDLADGHILGVEALSRFSDYPPDVMFAQAHRDGTGPALEAAAIHAALAHRRADRLLYINVSVPALLTSEVAAVLPEDMTGIVLEIAENSDIDDTSRLLDLLVDLKRRGARIAIDDWGRGFSNLDRILDLKPDIVKVDLSLTQGVDNPMYLAAIRAIVSLGDEVSVTICAEGVETEAQRHALQAVGVHTAQGYLFGRPTIPTALVHPKRTSVATGG